MIRTVCKESCLPYSLPRMRGDDPYEADHMFQAKAFAPHARG